MRFWPSYHDVAVYLALKSPDIADILYMRANTSQYDTRYKSPISNTKLSHEETDLRFEKRNDPSTVIHYWTLK